MNYAALKQQSKDSLRLTSPSPHKMALYFWLLVLAVVIPGEAISYFLSNATSNARTGISAATSQGTTAIYTTLIFWVMQAMTSLFTVGFANYALAVSRNQPANGHTILFCLKRIIPILLLLMIQYVLIFLWSCLLFLPGIIAAYRYRFAVYILLDNPKMSPLEAIRYSCHLTSGHKLQLLSLDIQFFWYYLLPFVGSIVLQLHAFSIIQIPLDTYALLGISYAISMAVDVAFLPYVQVTYANAYHWVCSLQEQD